MKNMRKLIPAIAMLLVSAVMMSTASFAWFSVANVATATGMQVKATSSGGIAIAGFTLSGTEIKAPADTAFKSSVNFNDFWNNEPNALKPVSLTTANDKWFTASSDKVDSANVNTAGYTQVTESSKDYMYHTKVQVKSLADSGATHLYIQKSTLTLKGDAGSASTTNALNAALRIALKVTDENGSKWYFIAPGIASGADHTPNHVKDGTLTVVDGAITNAGLDTYGKVDTAANTATANVNEIAYGQGSNICIYDTLTTKPVTVDIYVYYEGADPSCMTSYAIDLKDTAIDFEFYAG